MKSPGNVLLLLLIAAVTVVGCTENQEPLPATTITATPTTVSPEPAEIMPASVARAWTLSLMAIQNGRVIVRPAADFTLTVLQDGTIYGYSGCNSYNSAVTMTGETTQKGSAITVRPVTATNKYCEQVADQETTYLAILQNAMAFSVNGNKLTITAADGTALVYEVKSP